MLTRTKPTIEEARKAIAGDWEIGSGTTRKVFRLPGSPWAYKEEYSYMQGCQTNYKEYQEAERLKSILPSGFYIPEMQLIGEDILAVEFIDGEHPEGMHCFPGYHHEECIDSDFVYRCFWNIYGATIDDLTDDCHSENIIVTDDGKIYLIDLAVA